MFLTCLTWIPWISVLPTLLGPFSEEGNGILFLDTSTQKSQNWYNWSIFAPCFSWDQNHRCLSGELPKKFPEKSQASPACHQMKVQINVKCMDWYFSRTPFFESNDPSLTFKAPLNFSLWPWAHCPAKKHTQHFRSLSWDFLIKTSGKHDQTISNNYLISYD